MKTRLIISTCSFLLLFTSLSIAQTANAQNDKSVVKETTESVLQKTKSCTDSDKSILNKACCSKKSDCCKSSGASKTQTCSKAEKKACKKAENKSCKKADIKRCTKTTNSKTSLNYTPAKRCTANLDSCAKDKIGK